MTAGLSPGVLFAHGRKLAYTLYMNHLFIYKQFPIKVQLFSEFRTGPDKILPKIFCASHGAASSGFVPMTLRKPVTYRHV
ncbi:hypothetical protein KEM48_007257 [Puccinia striiformis f. sp. tritici PST-130]|nr:hypothetical protein H4Q26_007229 [Puccinia striiformis f. sp. tritici PST-130]KAI9622366.1 hypothetical protein KEM48_007257 [Puccinia striiformis f. sp. tritici PST-130]